MIIPEIIKNMEHCNINRQEYNQNNDQQEKCHVNAT